MTRRERRRQNRQKWRERRAGKKGKSKGSARRRARAASSGWSSDFALGRAWGIRAPKGMRRKKARRYVAREGMRRSRKAAGRRLSLHEVNQILSGTNLKAWICAGRIRTGCGGGKKRYGGSRQIGVLRP